MGGQSIPTKLALFDLSEYPKPIVADLFGEDSYFSDAETFWTLRGAAIERLRQQYREAGWTNTVIFEPGSYFHSWDHERVSRTKGGKVYIAVSHSGEVAVHEGWLSLKEVKQQQQHQQKAEGTSDIVKPVRSEMTASLQGYIDLHRHAAVRAELTQHPAVALRLLLAHAMAGSSLWIVKPDPQRAPTDALAESVENSPAEAAFDQQRREVMALLGYDPEQPTVTGGNQDIIPLFHRLLPLSNEDLVAVAAIVMGETLAVGSPIVATVDGHLSLDMSSDWQADTAFLDLLRSRAVLGTMIEEVAGPVIAASNARETVCPERTRTAPSTHVRPFPRIQIVLMMPLASS